MTTLFDRGFALLLSTLLLPMLMLNACAGMPPLAPPAETPAASMTPASSPTPSATAEPTATPPDATTTPTPTAAAPPRPLLCSPLTGAAVSDLPALVSNPYHPPRPGYDDPHAGVDLAIMLPGSRVAVPGNPVAAAFEGQVIMVAADRFPFGNALIIETPLNANMEQALAGGFLPTPAPTLAPVSALTCPPYPPLTASGSGRSLYTLYGHLRDAPAWKQGDSVACGQEIGAVGDSGNALNPHLHFETRVGPSGLRLSPIAHYDASATGEEMLAYCLWSVSGVFQLVDPLQAVGAVPMQPQ